MTEEPKPCPFCGGYANEVAGVDGTSTFHFFIMCKKCKVVMKSKLKDDLIERWNKREVA